MKLLLTLALGHLKGRPRQTVISISGVAVGIGFFIAMAAMMQGFQSFFISKVIDISPHIEMRDEFRNPDLQPVQKLYPEAYTPIIGLKPKDEKRGIRTYRKIIPALKRMPGLTLSKGLEGEGFLNYGSISYGVGISGIEPDDEKKISTLDEDMIEGSMDQLNVKQNGLLIGVGAAERLGVKMNDTLTIVSSEGVILRMKIVGIYSTGITNLDNRSIFVLLKKAQILMDRPNVVNRIKIKLDDVTLSQSLAEEIEGRFGYRTESWEETNENVLSLFKVQNIITYSTILAIMIVSSLGIFNIISTVVYEKMKDIAIMKSMGFQEKDLQRLFLIEGFVIGVVGSVFGWVLGYVLCQGLEQVPVEMKEGGFIRMEGLRLLYTPYHYIFSAVLAIFASVLAAYMPARKAAALQPVDIIRGAG